MPVKEPLPPLREDTHGVIPYAEPKLSLFQIEQEMAELIAVREECESDEERGVVDAQIQEYVGREIRKVTGIAALLKHFKAQAAMAKAEEERAAKWRKRWEANYERLKNMVHGVMLALDLPEVEGATDRFRRQKNPVALEITDAAAVPEQYLKATVKMSFADWKALVLLAGCFGDGVEFKEIEKRFAVTSEVDSAALKAALLVRIPCKDCKGETCKRCGGETTIPASVSGARLVQ